LETSHKLHRQNKPVKDRTKKNYEATYLIQIATWTATEASMTEQMLTLKTDRFKLEVKYKIVYSAYSGSDVEDNPDPQIQTIKQTKKKNDALFLKLKKLTDSIDNFLSPLLISTKPVSANFLFTLKNTTPIIKISDKLSDNVSSGDLDKITQSFKLTSDDFMSPNFKNKSDNSITNWKKYTDALKIAMFVLITKDPFPKYQNLKITNVQWIYFLYTDFVPTGATTFGFPGFPPFPTG